MISVATIFHWMDHLVINGDNILAWNFAIRESSVKILIPKRKLITNSKGQ